MDTIVVTVEPADYGAGETRRVTFPDSKYLVDERGDLHVISDGNVGAFPHGSWRAAVRGKVATEASTGRMSVTK